MTVSEHAFRVRRLYKLIFRVHRALPEDLRVLGDLYAREEFKKHKNCSRSEARIFIQSWTEYAIKLSNQTKPLKQAKKPVGEHIDYRLLDHMNDEQIVQLYELKKAATDESEGNNK